MALEIFRLVGSVFVDTDSAEKSLKKTDKSAEGLGSKLLSAGKTAGKFALAVGAGAVAVGAANLVDPFASKKIVDDLPGEMAKYGIENLCDIIGAVK